MNELWFENRKITVLLIHIALFFLFIFKLIARFFFFLRKIILHLAPGPLFVNGETRQHCQPDNNCFHYLFPPWLVPFILFPCHHALLLRLDFLSLSSLSKLFPQNLAVVFFLLFACLFFFKNVFLFQGKN